MAAELLDRIGSAGAADDIVVESGAVWLTRSDLFARVCAAAERLERLGSRCLALHADNGIGWIVTDLACQQLGIRCVPMPLFFSPTQVRHAIAASAADTLATDAEAGGESFAGTLRLRPLRARCDARMPPRTQKITFTSGTTGTPKGVCLSAGQQLRVAASLTMALGLPAPRHLCLLPLSTLLENLAGVYAPLLAGGAVIVPPLADVGIRGSSGLHVETLLGAIECHRPETLILVPELLKALCTAAECGWNPPASLRFVAVGGGKVARNLVARSRRAGLPAFEGYGLSECASVVTLNLPGAERPHSVGRPLPHARVHIDRGEVVVNGSSFLGYVDRPDSWGAVSVRTGDLGYVDADGFLRIDGRADNRIITDFGRNLSPEWVESELLAGPLLQQAVVFGDARPWCVALVWPRNPATPNAEIGASIRAANRRLPDYACVVDWRRLPEPLSAANGLLTDNGRPRRAEIERRHRGLIESLYERQPEAGNL